MLSTNGPGAEIGNGASRPSIERFAALVPREVTTRSGVVFYSGRDAFSSPSPLYLLGLNPGGDADVIGGTIEHHLDVALRDEPDNWSRYRDEPWGPGAKPGTWDSNRACCTSSTGSTSIPARSRQATWSSPAAARPSTLRTNSTCSPTPAGRSTRQSSKSWKSAWSSASEPASPTTCG